MEITEKENWLQEGAAEVEVSELEKLPLMTGQGFDHGNG